MEATIEVRGLRKSFGPTLALDGMTFTVAPGQITGFVGPNGAGKTITMQVILGLDAPDAGTALVGGHRYATLSRPLTHLGSLLDAAALQPGRTGRCSPSPRSWPWPSARSCGTPPGPSPPSSRSPW
jgi:ABC-2 type transport system ATP-binding protein